MSIWVQTLVKNEERYLWFAVMSVIEHVDRVLIWDTGSTDNTVAIIKEMLSLYPKKIDFKEVGEVDIYKYTDVRNEMLQATRSDWFMMLDGDEVWWDSAIKNHIQTIEENRNKLDTLVTKYFNVVGDIYHYQGENAGRYSIDGVTGHQNLRLINKNIPGLHFAKPHGQQGLFDLNGGLIQELDNKRRKHMGFGYMHFTNVIRSTSRTNDLKVPKRDIKLKVEKGTPFPRDFYFPEVFFRKKPDIVPSPWQVSDLKFNFKSAFISPLKNIKRNLKLDGKSGY